MRRAWLVGAAALAWPAAASAGPWTLPQGDGQVIVKWEEMTADQAFDLTGHRVDLLARRTDAALGVFAEYGMTDRLTLQLKGDWQSGEDAFVDYEGRGPVEIGVTWQAYRNDQIAVSLYGGYADGGDARNAGYAAPGQGDHDWEVRASVGSARQAPDGLVVDKVFTDLQVARRWRQGLPDELRIDATLGAHVGDDWMVLAQVFGGQADDGGPRWASVEGSVVRRLGDWSLQAGWRHAVMGRDTPDASGPVIAVWRRF